MRFIGNDPNILDAFYKATADGSIAAGKPVIVTAPGAPTLSSPVEFEAAGTYYYWGTFDSSNNKVIFTYQDNGNSDYGTAVVGTVSGNTVSFGTPVVFESAAVEHIRCTFDTSNNKVVVAYKDGGNSNYGTAVVGTVSGTSISFGTAVVFVSFGIVDAAITFDSNENKVVICYPGSSSYGNAVIGTVSGTSISFGSPVVFESANSTYIAATFDSSNNKVVLSYKDGGNSDRGTAIVGTVSGTSISFGSANVYENDGTYYIAIAFDSSANKVIIAYADSSGTKYEGKAVSAEVSGTSINITGNTLTFNSGTYLSTGLGLGLAYDSAANKTGLAYKDRGDGRASFAYLTVSGADLIRSDEATIFSAAGPASYVVPVYDSAAERIVIGYNDQTDSNHGKAVVAVNDTGGKIKAISETAISQAAGTPVEFGGTSYNISIDADYDSGNQKVVMAFRDYGNSSYGTARVGTVDNSDNSISFGTAVVFESATTLDNAVAYDANAGKIVIAYCDFSNSKYGTAVVGTVSGTGISFGTPVVFRSAESRDNHNVYDSTAQKVVCIYDDNVSNLYAIVGTVSGTSISFGSQETVHNNASYGTIDLAYDSANDKTVVFYVDNGDSQKGKAKVGTVSGTSISFGSAVLFQDSSMLRISAAYDSSAEKVVVAYADAQDSNKGKARVGTVSGTSISFGTTVEFEAGGIDKPTKTSYDVSAGKIVIAYRDAGNSNYGTVITGTVSGTSISFDTALVFEDSSTREFGSAYDANAERTAIFYEDSGDSAKGKSVVFRAASTSTNVTTENYIGITDQAYTDGQDATVAVVGCIDRNQTSLTAGQQYFVQGDGTLSTTAGSPSVLAGTAISATELVVKE